MTLHNFIHVFHAGRVTGTVIMELILAQELASVDQAPIFLVFFDLRESYDNLDHGWILKTLGGYGAGPKICGIPVELWACKEVVIRQNGYHGPHFRTTSRTTQGGLTSPIIFNVAVDSVVWHWLPMTVEDETVNHDRMRHAVGQGLELFYVKYDLLGLRYLEWIQGTLNVFIGLSRQIFLMFNIAKSKNMTCHMGANSRECWRRRWDGK